jgi:glycosyltransferase involved in cell wall biosynthesis
MERETAMRTSDRPRVLVIAEAANPEWVSVPLIGWSLSQALRAQADVHLVTQIRNREALLRAGLKDGVDFTAIDSEAVSRPMYRIASLLRMGKGKGWTMTTAMNALSYPYFEHLTWKRFGADIRGGRYDIVHRITPLTPTTVSPLAHKCAAAGVPFVVGPLNGGVPWPKGFDAERRREREWLSYVRGVYKALPGRQRMLRHTAAILTGSRFTQSEIPDKYAGKTIYIPENAIDPARFNRTAEQATDGPLRAAFVGRLVPYKGADMAIEAALPLLRSGRMIFDIVGDGPMRADLEALVTRHDLCGAVTLHGHQPHALVQDILAGANILLFPSVREFGGGVVLEAMALGVVPVIVDYAGPGELVSPETGLAVPIGTRAEIVARLRITLEQLADDRADLPRLSRNARAMVNERFTWAAKARQINEVYLNLCPDLSRAPS